eukprot:2847517-Amphidinium_carterae.1
MGNQGLLPQWHHSDRKALEDNADQQEIGETDEELGIRWRLKQPNNEGDHLPKWIGNIRNHREDLHPGTMIDDEVRRQEETEDQARADGRTVLEDRQDAHHAITEERSVARGKTIATNPEKSE